MKWTAFGDDTARNNFTVLGLWVHDVDMVWTGGKTWFITFHQHYLQHFQEVT